MTRPSATATCTAASTGTETRFSIYLPPAERYEGRFFQHITPVPDSENLAQAATGEEDKIGFAVDSGAYFLETNGGGLIATPGSDVDPTIGAYRANAAAAAHSRVIAAEMYGEHRPYGYAYGGSGGGFRTIGGAENTTGVWDGVVPYVIGSPMAIPNMFTVRMHAQRVLRHRFDAIVDAVEPGRRRRPVRRASTPRSARPCSRSPAWASRRARGSVTARWGCTPSRCSTRACVWPTPRYFDDFWSEPGLPRPRPARPRSGRRRAPPLRGRRRPHRRRGGRARPHRRSTAGPDPGRRRHRLAGGRRAGAGRSRPWPSSCPAPRWSSSSAPSWSSPPARPRRGPDRRHRADRRRRRLLGPSDAEVTRRLRPGDVVELDNRGFLAAQTYHRHQVPSPGLRGVGPVPERGRHPAVPAAPAAARAPVRRGRLRHGADRSLRREDDRGGVTARP